MRNIVAYLFGIIENALKFVTINHGLRFYEILAICAFAVFCVCIMIFGLIVNEIITKI